MPYSNNHMITKNQNSNKSFLYTKMSPLKTIHLHQIFKNLDKNGDGFVSIDELMWLLQRIGVQCKRDELKLLVGDKALDAVDFLFFYDTLVSKRNNIVEERYYKGEGEDKIMEHDLRKAFRVFDLNDDGFITSEELQIALSRLGLWDEQDCEHMIGVYDSNKDGLLDFEEFKAMMCA